MGIETGDIPITTPASASAPTRTRRTRTTTPKTTTPKTKTMMNNERIQKRIQELINAANYEINVDAYRGAFDNDNNNNNVHENNIHDNKIKDIRKYNSGRQFYLKCRDALHLCNADYHPTTNTNTNTNNNNNNNGCQCVRQWIKEDNIKQFKLELQQQKK